MMTFLLTMLLPLAPAAQEAVPSSPPGLPDEVREAARLDLFASAATGAVVAWIDRDGVRGLHAVGHTDLERSAPMEPDHLFHLGGFGDLLQAATALALGAEGILDLDAPVGPGVPGLPTDVGAVTVRQLLLQTAGFDASPLAPRRPGEPVQRIPPEEELALLRDWIVLAPPGALRSPSPHHGLVAGHVLEVVGGMPLAELVRNRFPALADLRVAPPGGAPEGAHPGFQVTQSAEGPHALAPLPEPSVLKPRERFWATGPEVAELLAGWLADPALLVDLARPGAPAIEDPDGRSGWSPGFRVTGGGRWIASGQGPGHSTVVHFEPESGVMVLVLANGGGSFMSRTVTALLELARDGAADAPASLVALNEMPMPLVSLERIVAPSVELAGTYRNGSEIFRLVERGGALAADPGVAEPFAIRVLPDGAFEAHLPDGRTTMRFHLFRDEEGGVLALYRGIVFRKEE
jgi:CubicO group peptidase (beta-lactamase class C family)